MRSQTSRIVQTGANSVVAMILSLVLIGCDTNPGGPSAPTRPPSPDEVSAPEPPTSVADGKKAAKRKLKRVIAQPNRTASFE